MMRKAVSGALVLLSLLAWGATPAQAALRVCNHTSYILYAATAIQTNDRVKTEGWTRIIPGGCATAIKGDLGKSTYYLYAHTAQAHNGPAHLWGGRSEFCVKDNDFSLEQPGATNRCPDDAFTAPFAQIDTKGQTGWTTTFTASPPLAGAEAARRAGLARLLGDTGYRLGALGKDDIEAALDKFRDRMKMPKDAGPSELFDALETEALKSAAPAGYSICNDTDAPVWAALALRLAKTWHTRGWWKITPGACARAIAEPLSQDKIYLLVERKDGRRLVSGPEDFCITTIAFDIERRGDCKKRGLVSAGFAVTDTGSMTGYAAHISEDGLLPTLRLGR